MVFRLFLFLLLITLPSVSALGQSAQDEVSDDAIAIIQTTPDPVNDYALGWFQQIFGDFIFAPWGGATQETGVNATIVAHAVGFTNVVALLLGIVIVVFVMVVGVIRTAHEGEVLGKSWSSTMLPLRTAIAFGFITPAVGVGGGVVSTIQAFVISLIIIGSNAGTLLWNKLGDYITDGAPLTAHQRSVGFSPSKQLLKSLVCSHSVYLYEQNNDSGRTEVAHLVFADYRGSQGISGPLDAANFAIPDQVTQIRFGNNQYDCGSVSFQWHDDTSAYRTYHIDALQQGHAAARQQIGDLLNELSTVAVAIVSGTAEGGLGGGKNLEEVVRSAESTDMTATQSVAAYYGRVAADFSRSFPLAIGEATVGDPTIAAAWKEDVTRGGWGAAGLWFFEISRFQMLSHNVTSKVVSSIADASPPGFCGFAGLSSFWSTCDDYEEMATYDMMTGVDIIHQMAIESLDGGDLSASEMAQARLELMEADKLDDGVFDDLASSLAQGILDSAASTGEGWSDGMAGNASVSPENNGLASPFRTVTAIGQTLNWGAGLAWMLGMLASIGHTTGVAVSGAMFGAGTLTGASVLAGIAWWVFVTMGALATAILPLGFVLAFMIPFMPIITWTRLLSAYLLTAIEAVVAAPLAVIMMATPEGEGIVGTRLERAIQMLAAVILKPTLMIIGLVSALLLAYVSFGILNFFFWRVAEMVTGSGIFELLAIIVIYTSAAYQVAKASIMVMHKLPDQILDWMAGGVGSRGFGEDAERGIEEGLSQAKGSLGSVSGGMREALTGRRKDIDRRNQARQQQQDDPD